jgi:hypothetical protein
MPFDSTKTQDRAELISTVSKIVNQLDDAATRSDDAAADKSTACDEILQAFKSALSDHDIPPFYFWNDICDANGYAHTRLDPATGKTSKVGGEKPHNTLKNVASQIKKYYENNRNLEIGSYTELRKENEPAPASDFEKAMKMTDKLSPEELTQVIIMRAVTKLSAEQIEEILEALNGEA